jgi:hypothetical protein
LHVFEGEGFGAGAEVVGAAVAGAEVRGAEVPVAGAEADRTGRVPADDPPPAVPPLVDVGDAEGDAEAEPDGEAEEPGLRVAAAALLDGEFFGRALAADEAEPSADSPPAAAGLGPSPGASTPSSARLRPAAARTKPTATKRVRRRRRRCAAALRSRRLVPVWAPRTGGPSGPPAPPRRRTARDERPSVSSP